MRSHSGAAPATVIELSVAITPLCPTGHGKAATPGPTARLISPETGLKRNEPGVAEGDAAGVPASVPVH